MRSSVLKHRFNWGWGAPKAGSLGGGDTGTGVDSDWPQTGGKSVLRNSTHPGQAVLPLAMGNTASSCWGYQTFCALFHGHCCTSCGRAPRAEPGPVSDTWGYLCTLMVSLLQPNRAQLPQSVLIRELLQTPRYPCSLSWIVSLSSLR